MANSPLSVDPNVINSLPGALKLVLKKQDQRKQHYLPAEVVSYEYDSEIGREFVRVKPLISILKTDNTIVERAEIPKIPVKNFGGNGFFMRFYLPPGSLGWIQACDKDISLFLNTYQSSIPNTERMNSFEDAVFFPDIMKGYTIAAEDEQAAVLQNIDGTVKISLTNERIKVTAPLVEIISPSDIIGDMSIQGNVDIQGNMSIDGDAQATGTVTGDQDVVGGGISLNSHLHSSGDLLDSTGAPVTGQTGEPI